MAFPSDTGSISQLATGLSRAMSLASKIKRTGNDIRSNSLAGTLTGAAALGYMNQLTLQDAAFAEIAAIPGIAQYARDQFDDQTFDIVVEFNAMRTEVIAVRDWLVTNIPVSAGGFVEIQSITNGEIVERIFTAGQTAGLVTVIDALLATID